LTNFEAKTQKKGGVSVYKEEGQIFPLADVVAHPRGGWHVKDFKIEAKSRESQSTFKRVSFLWLV
jgi:hypothetical protein